MIGETEQDVALAVGTGQHGPAAVLAAGSRRRRGPLRRIQQRQEIPVTDAQQHMGADERPGDGVLLVGGAAAASPPRRVRRCGHGAPQPQRRRGRLPGAATSPRSARRGAPAAGHNPAGNAPAGSCGFHPVAGNFHRHTHASAASLAERNGPEVISCSIASSQLSQREAPTASSATGLKLPASSACSAVRVCSCRKRRWISTSACGSRAQQAVSEHSRLFPGAGLRRPGRPQDAKLPARLVLLRGGAVGVQEVALVEDGVGDGPGQAAGSMFMVMGAALRPRPSRRPPAGPRRWPPTRSGRAPTCTGTTRPARPGPGGSSPHWESTGP